jgi:hypothetical protein
VLTSVNKHTIWLARWLKDLAIQRRKLKRPLLMPRLKTGFGGSKGIGDGFTVPRQIEMDASLE